MRKLSTSLKTGMDRGVTGLHLPGMMRESPARQLKTNLGAASKLEHRPSGGGKGKLAQNSAPQKHQMEAFPAKKWSFGGPGSTMPV